MNFTSREEYEGHIKGVLISKEEISEAVEKAGKRGCGKSRKAYRFTV